MPKVKDKGGRPSKYCEKIVEKLEEGFHNDFTIDEACAYANIDKGSYYNRLDKKKGFSTRMDNAKKVPFILAKKGLLKHVKEGDKYAQVEFLKRRAKLYSDKVEKEVKEISISVEDLQNMSEEELQALYKKM